MRQSLYTKGILTNRKLVRLIGTSAVALTLGFGSIAPAFATIDNTATAYGTNSATDDTVSNTSTVNVDVITLSPDLTTTVSITEPTTSNGVSSTAVDGADTITISYTVKNTGNTTLTGVTPDFATLPSFGGQVGTGTMGTPTISTGSSTLAPGEEVVYTVTYTLTDADITNSKNGPTPIVDVATTSSGTKPDGTTVFVDPDTSTIDPNSPFGGSSSTYTIPDNAVMTLVKTFVLTETAGVTTDAKAEVGDTITYTYTVKNTGNVDLTNVKVSDTHEGTALAAGTVTNESLVTDGPGTAYSTPLTSTDASTDGKWDTLQPGATVKFTYTHTVTQAEIDNQ